LSFSAVLLVGAGCGEDAPGVNATCPEQGGPPDNCQTHADCDGDRCCLEGSCESWGGTCGLFDPACEALEPCATCDMGPAALVRRCAWTENASHTTPFAVDLDGDGVSEVISGAPDVLAIRGGDCGQVWESVAEPGTVAVGDLDEDGTPEIAVRCCGGLAVTGGDGSELDVLYAGANIGYAQPMMVNVDAMGPPEVVSGKNAFRLDPVSATLESVHTIRPYEHGALIDAVADVDLDGAPEIVHGNRLYDALTAVDKTPSAMAARAGGRVAIGDFDPSTPEPEIAVVGSAEARVQRPNGDLLLGPYLLETKDHLSGGGAPVIADFDGDGAIEFGVAQYWRYTVFDPECEKLPLPSVCESTGVRWSKTINDSSSGHAGASAFDFDGDGASEVVYRDQCWLRVIDGATGTTRAAAPCMSITGAEMPIVADVDADGAADIVVGCDTYSGCSDEADLGLPFTEPPEGIHIYHHPSGGWADARRVWNQYAYHIANVNDDGTIPIYEGSNWKTHNSYREQERIGSRAPRPDVTVGTVDPSVECLSDGLRFHARVANRGNLEVPAGISVGFYRDALSAANLMCATVTAVTLGPGEETEVSCLWPEHMAGPLNIVVFADGDGTSRGEVAECHEGNNGLRFCFPGCSGG